MGALRGVTLGGPVPHWNGIGFGEGLVRPLGVSPRSKNLLLLASRTDAQPRGEVRCLRRF